MLTLLLAGAVVFAVIAWLIAEPTIKKVSLVGFAVCALLFLVLVILQAVRGGLP